MTPTDAQMRAGCAAALALKSQASVKSFTAETAPYVRAIYEAMTAEHLMPAPAIAAKPRARKPRATRKEK